MVNVVFIFLKTVVYKVVIVFVKISKQKHFTLIISKIIIKVHLNFDFMMLVKLT